MSRKFTKRISVRNDAGGIDRPYSHGNLDRKTNLKRKVHIIVPPPPSSGTCKASKRLAQWGKPIKPNEYMPTPKEVEARRKRQRKALARFWQRVEAKRLQLRRQWQQTRKEEK